MKQTIEKRSVEVEYERGGRRLEKRKLGRDVAHQIANKYGIFFYVRSSNDAAGQQKDC